MKKRFFILSVSLLFQGLLDRPAAFAGMLNSQENETVLKFKTVVQSGENLGQISTRLYNTSKRWKKIAEWNGLVPPYSVRTGQVLKLAEEPPLSEEQGHQALLQMWRKRFGLPLDTPIRSLASLAPHTTPAQSTHEIVKKAVTPAPPALSQKEEKMVEETKKENKTFQVNNEIDSIKDVSKMDKKEIEKVEKNIEALAEPQFEAKGYFELGQKFMQAKQYEKASAAFRKSRTMDPELLGPWFYEIKALKLLFKDDEAKKVVVELLDHKPELKDLPVLQTVHQPGGQ